MSEKKIVSVSGEKLQQGLEKAHWEGRMEEILPDVYLDGAHNPDGIAAFLKSVQADGADNGRILLYSALAEKACGEMAEEIAKSGAFREIVVTEIENSRAAKPRELAALFGERDVVVIENWREAFDYCLHKKKTGEKVYITGSLYLAGQVLAGLRTGEI